MSTLYCIYRTLKFTRDSTSAVNEHTIYPYVHSFSNIRDKTALLRPISFPDVSPSALPPGSNFSLVAGAQHLSPQISRLTLFRIQATSRRFTVPTNTRMVNLKRDSGMQSSPAFSLTQCAYIDPHFIISFY